jgi:DNA-binding CsgD family transcriptional regulator
LKVELFIGTGLEGPAVQSGGAQPVAAPDAARLLMRRPDVSVDLSPALEHTLGESARQLVRAAEGLLRTMGPQASALADALEETVGKARSAGSVEAPFVMVVSAGESAAAAPAVLGGAVTIGPARPPALTLLEREIIARVAAGETDGQIAAELFISRRTVQNHLHRIREKTGLLTRADLIRWASTTVARAS